MNIRNVTSCLTIRHLSQPETVPRAVLFFTTPDIGLGLALVMLRDSKENQMKMLILTLSFLTAFTATAKVGDFNSLINENSKAQSELHQNLKQDLETTRMAYQKEKTNNFIVDSESNSINVPSPKSLLTFKKEKKYYRASEAQKQKRLAEEMSEAQ